MVKLDRVFQTRGCTTGTLLTAGYEWQLSYVLRRFVMLKDLATIDFNTHLPCKTPEQLH